MRLKFKSIILAAMMLFCVGASTACADAKQDIININIWTYYAGSLKTTFDEYVKQFNSGYGMANGIIVNAESMGKITDLTTNLQASAKKEPNAKPMPDMFSGYADTAYMINKIVPLADFKSTFSAQEIAEYMPSYIEDGMIDNKLMVFPALKSTEVMIVRADIWEAFKADDSTISDSIMLYEETIVTAATKYAVWAKEKRAQLIAQGKVEQAQDIPLALYGRDAIDNYFLSGMSQLGKEVYTVDGEKATITFDKTAAKTLYDNYYLPYMDGVYSHKHNFVTGSIGNREVVAGVGSSAAASNYPEGINLKIFPAPTVREGAMRNYTLQGAGLCAVKSTPEKEKAYAQFIKWFTDADRNMQYSLESGYLPVKVAVSNYQAIAKFAKPDTKAEALETIRVSLSTIASADKMYCAPFFAKSNDVRNLLKKVNDKCKQDYDDMMNKPKANPKDPTEEVVPREPAEREAKLAQYKSEESFNAWYNKLKGDLEAIIA